MLALLRSIALALILTAIATSQQPPNNKSAAPPDPCDNATTQMELTICTADQAKKADDRLSALYDKIQKAIQASSAQDASLESYHQRTLDKLRAAQLAWSHYRDAECAAEEQQNEGGTIAPSVHSTCMKNLADRRMTELRRTYAMYLEK